MDSSSSSRSKSSSHHHSNHSSSYYSNSGHHHRSSSSSATHKSDNLYSNKHYADHRSSRHRSDHYSSSSRSSLSSAVKSYVIRPKDRYRDDRPYDDRDYERKTRHESKQRMEIIESPEDDLIKSDVVKDDQGSSTANHSDLKDHVNDDQPEVKRLKTDIEMSDEKSLKEKDENEVSQEKRDEDHPASQDLNKSEDDDESQSEKVKDSQETSPSGVVTKSNIREKVILNFLDPVIISGEKLEKTPSAKDGMDPEDEMDLRLLGCELIQSSGILLRLPQVAMATGQVLFQRFYYSQSFVRHNMEITAAACVALASKIEESPRRIRDVINVFTHLKQMRNGRSIKPIPLDNDYILFKNAIIKAERRLLRELGFCVHIKHPHKFIVTLLQILGCERNEKLVQSSWNYMNDCLRTNLFVRYTPETIACSCIQLSARVMRIPLPPGWYEIFGTSEEQLNDVCKTALGIYGRRKPDQLKLETTVNDLKDKLDQEKMKTRMGSIVNNGSK